MRLVVLLAAVLPACSGAQHRPVETGCAIALGALDLCGSDCSQAFDVVSAACAVLSGGQVDVCSVALKARGLLPPVVGATLPNAPPAGPPEAPSSPAGGGH